jgi:hypothetical protein
MVLAVTAIAVRDHIGGKGFRITLLSAALYVPVATWHFVEHANGTDPELAHVLLTIAYIGMLAGAVIAALEARRRAAPA